VFLVPDFAYYRQVSARVMDLVRSLVETVEVVGLDEAYLDLSGLPAPKAAMRRLVHQIEASTRLGGSVGIGPNKLVAKVASDAEKPRGFVALTGEQACERFRASPCGLIPGIGPKTVERLRAEGIATLGDLAAAPPARLAERFGARLGAELARRARFEDAAPVTQERKVISESRETTFDTDIADPRQLEAILAGLSERLWTALEGQGRCGRTVSIKVRLTDFSTYTRARTFPEPVNSAQHLEQAALKLLRCHPPARPVRLLGVRVAGLQPAGASPVQQLALGV
jgi:DNA polymerase-4